LYADDYDPNSGDQNQTSDSYAAMMNGMTLPPGSTPYLYFKQAFGFEYDNHGSYDGGVLEYSTDGGTTWIDAKALFSAGQNYNGTIFTVTTNPNYLSYDNPLHGRSAFVKDSHGYVASRYNLTSLVGKTVMFRWRMGTDFVGYGDLGWNVDDVRIYNCIAAPSVPVLSLPANASLTTNYSPTLDWKDSTPVGDTYELQVATSNTFASPILDANALSSSIYTFPSALNPNTTYYWRVRATNLAAQTSAWSLAWTFRTALLPPTLIGPANDSINTIHTTFPTFTWSNPNSSGVTGYTVQISKVQNFSSVLITGSPTTTSFTPTTALPASAVLYWRVQVRGANGPSAWSSPAWAFKTGNPPSVPTLLTPANASLYTNTNYTPTFKWNASTPALGTSLAPYEIQVATSNTFASPVIDANPAGISYLSGTVLNPNTTYYWRVRAYNTLGDFSGWSATRTLRTFLSAVTLTAPTNGGSGFGLTPTFTWSDPNSSGVTGYTIQISRNTAFTLIVVTGSPTTASFKPTASLPTGIPLYWRVQVKGPNGPSAWTTFWSVQVP
jgi:large repetitive protein